MTDSDSQTKSQRRGPFWQAAILVLVGFVLWGLLVGPAWLLAGQDGLAGLTVAAAICLLAGVPILFFVGLLSNSQSMLPLLGSVLRLVFVFCGCLAVLEFMPAWGFREFLIWLIIFYFVLLVVETVFILQGLKVDFSSNGSDSSVQA